MRDHLATLLDDFRRYDREVAVVRYKGNRRRVTTYGEIARLSGRFAALLETRGIGPGDRVLIWAENGAEWIAAFHGCLLRGVLAVPLDANGTADFAIRVAADVNPKLAVGDAVLLSQLGADGAHGNLPQIFFEDWLTHLPAEEAGPVSGLSAETPLEILFTSGTTGDPKGVVLTHGNVLASIGPIEDASQPYLRYERLIHPLRILHTLPLSHVFGQTMGLWVPPIYRAELHFESRLVAPRLVETIRRERISVLAAVPRVLALLRMHLETALPGLAGACRGSRSGRKGCSHPAALVALSRCSRCPRPEVLGFDLRWRGVAGTTREILECSGPGGGAGLRNDGNDCPHNVEPSFSRGAGNDWQAVGWAGSKAGSGWGSVGARRVNLRSYVVARRALHAREDEWLATGDLAEKEPTGELRFLGRKSEVIVTASGLNLHPEDLEAAIDQSPGVTASAVVATETANGPEPCAVIAFRGTGEEAAAAIEQANTRLAEFQRLRRWVLWPEPDLPRTSTGKVRRKAVAEWLARSQSAAATAHTDKTIAPGTGTFAASKDWLVGADCADYREKFLQAWAMNSASQKTCS